SLCWKQTLKVLRPLIREKGAINAEVTGRLTESLGGVRVVKGYHAEERERQAFGAGVKKLLDNALRSVAASATLNAASAITLGLLGAVILFLGARLILNGQMTPGGLFS